MQQSRCNNRKLLLRRHEDVSPCFMGQIRQAFLSIFLSRFLKWLQMVISLSLIRRCVAQPVHVSVEVAIRRSSSYHKTEILNPLKGDINLMRTVYKKERHAELSLLHNHFNNKILPEVLGYNVRPTKSTLNIWSKNTRWKRCVFQIPGTGFQTPLSVEYRFRIPNSNRQRDSGLQGPRFQIPESGLLFVGRYNQKNRER